MIPLHDDNPTTRIPAVTLATIAACVLAFLWQFSLGERGFEAAVQDLGMIPASLFSTQSQSNATALSPAFLTLFTSMFLHGGWVHLTGNMLYLWIFGNNVEDATGHMRFVLFYLVCGVAAALVQASSDPDSTVPMVGASGAISGVLGAYLLLYPRARILVFVPLGFYARLLRLPALWVLGFWFVLQVLNAAATGSGQAGVAWGAHVGGFIAGLVLVPIFKRKDVRLLAPPRTSNN